jgi:hypothetical protein
MSVYKFITFSRTASPLASTPAATSVRDTFRFS